MFAYSRLAGCKVVINSGRHIISVLLLTMPVIASFDVSSASIYIQSKYIHYFIYNNNMFDDTELLS